MTHKAGEPPPALQVAQQVTANDLGAVGPRSPAGVIRLENGIVCEEQKVVFGIGT